MEVQNQKTWAGQMTRIWNDIVQLLIRNFQYVKGEQKKEQEENEHVLDILWELELPKKYSKVVPKKVLIAVADLQEL